MLISAIFLAGGKGSRMQSSVPKQYLPLHGKAVALYSLETLASHPKIFEIIVVCEEEYRPIFSGLPLKFALPGLRRQDSLFNGLQEVHPDSTCICVHDSARPFLSFEDLDAVLKAAEKYGASTLATPLKNSIKYATQDGCFIEKTIDRNGIWEMQTPQVALRSLLTLGFAIAQTEDIAVTDDNALVELTGHPIKLVEATARNFKITTPDDLHCAEALVGATYV